VVRVRVSDVTIDVPIAPFSHVQFALQREVAAPARFEVISGDARVIAYASVIDTASNDAVFEAAVPDVPHDQTFFAPIINSGSWQTFVNGERITGDAPIGIARFEQAIPPIGRIVNGHFGEALPFATRGLTSGDIIHIEVSEAFRSNLLVMNVGALDAVVNVDGTTFTLAPMTLRFLPLRAGTERVHIEASAPVLAYASLIDNSTGDPMLIPVQ
jgi:hypothetical protein